MGPSRKHRDDAADQRRQEVARQRLAAEQADRRAAEAERKATEKKGGK